MSDTDKGSAGTDDLKDALELSAALTSHADFLAQVLVWLDDDNPDHMATIVTGDAYDPKNPRPQSIEGPYAIYRLLDIDEDDSGAGPLQTLLRRSASALLAAQIRTEAAERRAQELEERLRTLLGEGSEV